MDNFVVPFLHISILFCFVLIWSESVRKIEGARLLSVILFPVFRYFLDVCYLKSSKLTLFLYLSDLHFKNIVFLHSSLPSYKIMFWNLENDVILKFSVYYWLILCVLWKTINFLEWRCFVAFLPSFINKKFSLLT